MMELETPPIRDYPADVRILTIEGREFILVGTAHISQKSVDLVRAVIERENPDAVCVELDSQRYQALSEQRKWEALDLKEVIRKQQLSTLMVNLLLAAYQKRLGDKLGMMPGLELLEATKVAQEYDIPIVLCDRDVRITLRRAWYSMSFFEKINLLAAGLAGAMEEYEISEETLSRLREQDVLSELMQELGRAMPVLKTVLIDERDTYLTHKMRAAEGDKIVAVVGAGHVEGIAQALQEHRQIDLSQIEQIPPLSPVWKWVGWGIPALILGSIAYIGWDQGLQAAGDNLLFWLLASSTLSSIGALLALGHPLTILSAFLAAPITVLSPVIGVGHVTAFVQAYFQPPLVKEFQTVIDDVNSPLKWWQNKLLRILLVFILSSLGGVIGTYIGTYEIVTNLF